MATVLKEACGFTEVNLLLGKEASSQRVKRAVLQLARDRSEQDFLLLYFAGHGHLMMTDGGQQDIFLVTHDFDELEVNAGLHFSMRWLRDQLYLSPDAGKILLVLDCCYAGNMGRTASDPYDANLTVAHLWAEQRTRGTFAITGNTQEILQHRLFRTFEQRQSWLRVETSEAQRLFKLACFFPDAVPVPLWLVGIAANLPGSNTSLDPLGQARRELQCWSMIEVLPDDMIRLHSLLREFGHYFLQNDAQSVRSLASVNLLAEFTNINTLEARARAKDYWGCLHDVQEALSYAQLLPIEHLDLFERVASWLARESSLLGASDW
jgi:hypothetical protein